MTVGRPTVDLDRARFLSNQRAGYAALQQRPRAVAYMANILSPIFECHTGFCDLRHHREHQQTSIGIAVRCIGCGLLRNDWDTTSPTYLPWSEHCPDCVSERTSPHV